MAISNRYFRADLKIAIIMNFQLHIVLYTMLSYMKQICSVIAAHIKLCTRVPTSFFIKFSERLRAISTGLFYLATRNSSFRERPLELAKFRRNGLQELAMFVQWAQANLIMSQRHWPPFQDLAICPISSISFPSSVPTPVTNILLLT